MIWAYDLFSITMMARCAEPAPSTGPVERANPCGPARPVARARPATAARYLGILIASTSPGTGRRMPRAPGSDARGIGAPSPQQWFFDPTTSVAVPLSVSDPLVPITVSVYTPSAAPLVVIVNPVKFWPAGIGLSANASETPALEPPQVLVT